MSYGTIKVDTITFTDGGVDKSVSVSGFIQNPTITGNISVTGTISGNLIEGQTISGTTVTGNTGVFTTVTGGSAGFTTVTGTTVTGTTANFATLSGTTITGSVGNFGSGSAAAPSVSVGTTDNGIYSPGTDQVAISTNGTGRLFVDASGIVEMRSTAALLNIVDTDTARAGAVNSFIAFRGSDDQKSYIGCPGTGDTRIWGRTADPILFGTNDSERLRITSDGKVGLGTSSPQALLDVRGGFFGIGYNAAAAYPAYNTYFGAIGSNFSNGGSELDIWNTVGGGFALRKQTGASAQSCLLYISSAGNVGVGTTVPSAKLTVNETTGTGATYLCDLTAPSASQNPLVRIISRNAANTSTTSVDLYKIYQSGFQIINNDTDASNFTSFTVGSSERLRITSDGKVGLGTSDPGGVGGGATLNISATGGARVVLNSASRRFYVTGKSGSDDLRIGRRISTDTVDDDIVTITGGGNVGVGTTSPGSSLQIGDGTGFHRALISGANCDLLLGPATGATFGAASDAITLVSTVSKSTPLVVGTIPSQPLLFGTNNQERARIDSSGRLLIGQSGIAQYNSFSPDLSVQISRGDNLNANIQIGSFRSDQFGGGLVLSKSRSSTVGTNTIVQNNDVLGSVSFNGADGTNWLNGGAINCRVDAVPGTGSMPTRLDFSTRTATGSAAVVRSSISRDGTTTLNAAASTSPFIAQINSSEVTRIDGSGRLLVGTSSAQSVSSVGLTPALQLNSSSSSQSSSSLGIFANSATNNCRLALFRNRATTAGGFDYTGGTVQSGDVLGEIEFYGVDGQATPTMRIGASIEAVCESTPTTAEMPSRLVFSTNPGSPATAPVERMRISADGHISIATTSKLDANYKQSIFIDNTGGTVYRNTTSGTHYPLGFQTSTGTYVGSVSTTSTATTYATSSDYRLKENVTSVTDGITRLQQLKPSRFNFIADPTKTVDGFLAHEVQDIVPEAITGEKDAVDENGDPQYQGIDQSKLVPLLTAALQEAIGEIESLKARVAALESA